MDDRERGWYAMDGGGTIGQRGPGKGTIIADAEYGDPGDTEDADARLTLERLPDGTFVLTGQVYPWAYGQSAAATEAEADEIAELIRKRLEVLADAIPDEDERDLLQKTTRLQQLCADFEAEYPAI
ncbi:MAG: hypothetical protein ACOVP2_09595 [Armatimonadaceae bacterium]